MPRKLPDDGPGPRCNAICVSLDSDSLARLQYVADYFEWPATRVASNVLARALASVKFGEDLSRSDWSDPRLLKKLKSGGALNGKN